MNYNKIDLTPLLPGYGMVWQGGSVDQDIESLPGPMMIVCMDNGEFNENYIEHGKSVEAVLAVWIDDSPNASLSDTVLLGLVHSVKEWLALGGNVYVHCAAGISRASYFDIALHMYCLKLDYNAAYELVHAQRPVINPNSGFVDHLKRLEAQLKGS